jgi:hypothetical protein
VRHWPYTVLMECHHTKSIIKARYATLERATEAYEKATRDPRVKKVTLLNNGVQVEQPV